MVRNFWSIFSAKNFVPFLGVTVTIYWDYQLFHENTAWYVGLYMSSNGAHYAHNLTWVMPIFQPILIVKFDFQGVQNSKNGPKNRHFSDFLVIFTVLHTLKIDFFGSAGEDIDII